MANQYYDGVGNQGGRRGGSGDRSDTGKIFVGGLSRDTGDDELRDYFSNYGSVVECMVKRDPNTGHSRGFGFVSFKDPSSVDKVLAERQHTLQGKVIDPKRAQARGASGGPEVCRKIFVGGLDPNLTEDKIREYFGRFGTIDLIEQPFDREKNIKKGFCFITFDSGDAVDMICVNQKHHVGGRDVDVKKATPKEKMAAANSRGGMGGQRGGGAGRGRGTDGYIGWESQPGYSAVPGYPTYDYSAYYAQQAAVAPAYGAYGQAAAPAAYGASADPYGQAYGVPPVAPTAAYDYSAWYGAAAPAQPAAQNGGGAVYGRGQRPAESRYQPY
jgi:hypothetical protein